MYQAQLFIFIYYYPIQLQFTNYSNCFVRCISPIFLYYDIFLVYLQTQDEESICPKQQIYSSGWLSLFSSHPKESCQTWSGSSLGEIFSFSFGVHMQINEDTFTLPYRKDCLFSSRPWGKSDWCWSEVGGCGHVATWMSWLHEGHGHVATWRSASDFACIALFCTVFFLVRLFLRRVVTGWNFQELKGWGYGTFEKWLPNLAL